MVAKLYAKDTGFDYKNFKGKTPEPSHYDSVIDYDCDIYFDGKEQLALLTLAPIGLNALNQQGLVAYSKCQQYMGHCRGWL